MIHLFMVNGISLSGECYNGDTEKRSDFEHFVILKNVIRDMVKMLHLLLVNGMPFYGVILFSHFVIFVGSFVVLCYVF